MKDMKSQKIITRRVFMKGAAVAGGALAGMAMPGGPLSWPRAVLPPTASCVTATTPG